MAAPWYASYPTPQIQLPTISLYTFASKPLEALVYTQPSSSSSWHPPGATAPIDNSVLRWTGASVIQSLASILLTSLYPDLKEGSLSDLRNAITAPPFLAHLTRTITLHSHLPPPQSDSSLAHLFESYIGGIQRDLGTEKFGELYTWYFRVVEPFCVTYHSYYQQYLETNGPQATNSSISIQALPAPPSQPQPSGSPAAPAGNAQPGDAKTRRQNVAGFTSRLMEFAAKSRMTPPNFEFSDNGQQGAAIQWTATVSLNGQQVARAVASTKLEAKHLASREALTALRAPLHFPQDRRDKKKDRRKRGGGFGGGMGGHGGQGGPNHGQGLGYMGPRPVGAQPPPNGMMGPMPSHVQVPPPMMMSPPQGMGMSLG